MARAMGVRDWVHVLGRLPVGDQRALAAAVPGVNEARRAWSRDAPKLAKLVTFADGDVLACATPSVDGYIVDTRGLVPTFESPRRMFVHQYAMAVGLAAAATGASCRVVTSVLAFDQSVAPAVGCPARADNSANVPWPGSRITTRLTDGTITPLVAARQHARHFLTFRLDAPRKYRGRRARDWTKVRPADALPLPCG